MLVKLRTSSKIVVSQSCNSQVELLADQVIPLQPVVSRQADKHFSSVSVTTPPPTGIVLHTPLIISCLVTKAFRQSKRKTYVVK